jgi:hypothetical protein
MRRGNVLADIAKRNFILTSSCVMTRPEIFKSIGKFDSIFKISDDWDMWLRIAKAGHEFDLVPEYLVNYFVHSNNTYYGQTKTPNRLEFGTLCKKHEETATKYNVFGIGHYYYSAKNYSLSRKYFIKTMLSRRYLPRERIVAFAYIIISFAPWSEKFLYILWKHIIKPLFIGS